MSLKAYYDQSFAAWLAERIVGRHPSFDKDGFVSFLNPGSGDKEYSARMLDFVEAFDRFLPAYPETLRIFSELLGPELPSFAVMYDEGAWLAPIGKYVEIHGPQTPEFYEQTLGFIHELTKRYTGEFAMRPLIQAFPERTLAVLLEWSLSDCAYIRRCASECMRVRLPWAKKLTAAVEHVDAYMAVLDNLRQDANPYVQRSVGNNLNDLFKHDASLAHAIIDRWQKDPLPMSTRNIIRHGTRSQRKRKVKSAKNAARED